MDRSLKLFCLFICTCLLFYNCQQNKNVSSEEALAEFKKLEEIYKDVSYINDRETWLELSYLRSQLISKISNDHELVLNFYHHSGYDFKLYKLYRESLNMYKAFFKYYDTNESEFSLEIKEEFSRKRTFDYRGTALAYEKLGILDSAYLEHQKNLKLIETKDNIYNPAAYNDFGMFLAGSLKDTVSALREFKKAYQFTSSKFPEHDLIGSIRNNLASIYYDKQMFDEAYDLYYSNYVFYKKYRERNLDYNYEFKALESAVKVLEILKIQNEIKSLNSIYNDVIQFYFAALPTSNVQEKIRLEFLKVKLQYILSGNDFQKSYQILDSIKILSDHIILDEANSQRIKQEKWNDLSLFSLKSNYLLKEKQKEAELLNHRLVIWIISIGAFFFLAVLAFLLYRRRQHIVHARNKQLISEQDLELSSIKNKQLKLEIESKKRDLSDFAINLIQNQDWAKVLANKLELLKTTKGRERKKLMDDFENEVLAKTTFDTNTKEFFERLDKLSDSFYSHLNSEFPDLSKTEKRLCSLIRLKIESRNIATIQNISLGSLNKGRYRLRKKLNLSKDLDLDRYIQSL